MVSENSSPVAVVLGVSECSLIDSTDGTHTACGGHRMRESRCGEQPARLVRRGEGTKNKSEVDPSDVTTPPPPDVF